MREVAAKEEGVLHPSRGYGERERSGSGAISQQVRFVGRYASARLDVFRPHRKRNAVFEVVVSQEAPPLVCAPGVR